MRTSLVYDGRNIHDIKDREEAEVEYYSVGRKSVTREDIKETKDIEL